MRLYKIRSFKNGVSSQGKEFVNYSLTVPGYIAERLPKGMEFACELTDQGVLFKPSKLVKEEQQPVPDWAKNGKPLDTSDKVGS